MQYFDWVNGEQNQETKTVHPVHPHRKSNLFIEIIIKFLVEKCLTFKMASNLFQLYIWHKKVTGSSCSKLSCQHENTK